MPRVTKANINKKKLLDALEKTLGVVTTACSLAGISRHTFYAYCKKDIKFKEKVESIGDIALDFAETQLYKKIKSGDTAATIFYLKTKGKKRGYIESLRSRPDDTPTDTEKKFVFGED